MTLLNRSYPRLLLVALTAALALTLFVTAGTSSVSLGTYNPAWDGTSDMRATAEETGTETIIGQNSSTYTQGAPNRTVAVILSPSEPYDQRETDAIESFVESGGTLLVAEDYGPHGNELLAAIGAEARVTGVPLRDEQRAGPSPAFPRAEPVMNYTYTTGVDGIMLNYGSSVEPNNATTLIQSSEFSYLDSNGNDTLDESEELGARPVVTVEPVGSGTVVVVSDPSIFLNSMRDRADNAAFVTAIVGSHERLLLDVSHTSSVPPLIGLRLILQESGPLLFLAGTLSVVGVLVLAHPPGLSEWLRKRRDPDELPSQLTADDIASTIRAKHPEWDEERVERVTNSLMTNREEQNIND